MKKETLEVIRNNPIIYQYLRDNSSWYKELNRNSNVVDNILKEAGYINIYDEETGNLLVSFTKDNWNRNTRGNPYMYETPVKHIRIETSSVNSNANMNVYNIKKIGILSRANRQVRAATNVQEVRPNAAEQIPRPDRKTGGDRTKDRCDLPFGASGRDPRKISPRRHCGRLLFCELFA